MSKKKKAKLLARKERARRIEEARQRDDVRNGHIDHLASASVVKLSTASQQFEAEIRAAIPNVRMPDLIPGWVSFDKELSFFVANELRAAVRRELVAMADSADIVSLSFADGSIWMGECLVEKVGKKRVTFTDGNKKVKVPTQMIRCCLPEHGEVHSYQPRTETANVAPLYSQMAL